MEKKIGVALCVLGVLLTIFGIMWVTVLWPSLSRIPAGLDQETIQEGTVTLYNAHHDAYDNYSVTNSRHYVAVKASKDIVYLDETITFTDTATGQKIPSLNANYLLGIDRVTRRNVPWRGDGNRDGCYSFPFNVSKTETYPFWNEGNPANLDCSYIGDPDGEEVFEGLKVYTFHMKTPDEGLVVPGGFDMPEMRVDQEITMKVEPVSGVTVYFESTTRRSGKIPVPDALFPTTGPLTYRDVAFYEDHLTFSQDTIDDLVEQAKGAKMQIAFARFLPWLSISGGIVLVVVGVFLVRRTARAQSGSNLGQTSACSR